ncbi:MAG: hypothetical protein ACTS8S_20380, partial [Giesbergeria sp.]
CSIGGCGVLQKTLRRSKSKSKPALVNLRVSKGLRHPPVNTMRRAAERSHTGNLENQHTKVKPRSMPSNVAKTRTHGNA